MPQSPATFPEGGAKCWGAWSYSLAIEKLFTRHRSSSLYERVPYFSVHRPSIQMWTGYGGRKPWAMC